MADHPLYPRNSLINKLLDKIVLENKEMDTVVIHNLMHQLEGVVDVMGEINEAIHDQESVDRHAAEKLRAKIENIRQLRDSWDNPEQIDKIINDLQELADTMAPKYNP